MAKRPIVDRLRAMKRTIPFGRHVVRLADGEMFRLTRPDRMLVDPRGQFLTCYDDRERPHHLNVRQIASIEPVQPTTMPADAGE